jgi:glycerol-3-phosphate dehydrogenase
MVKKAVRVQKAIHSKGITGIECSPWRESIRLTGEARDYLSLFEAGKTAAKFGYKGVVNDIRLSGFDTPRMSMPATRDDSLHNKRPDVLIIGGGVIGCAIAREMAKYRLSVMLIEKEPDVAMHASSRNDGMIHPGIGSQPDTLRGIYNVRGNAMYTELTRELDVEFSRIGNLIMYGNPALFIPMSLLFAYRSSKLRIQGKHLDRKELYRLEPHLKDGIAGGFLYPSSGILSPYKLTVALAENAVENGVLFSLETAAEKMETQGGRITGVITNRGTIRPRVVVNAAGVFADTVAGMADDRFFSIHPRKGELIILDKKKGGMAHTSMSVVTPELAHSDTKGGGIMPTIDGNVLVGPDAYEQPFREDFSTNAERIRAIMEKHLTLIKGCGPGDVIAYFAGIRAATYEEDFIIEKSASIKNLVHAAGIQSPGLAAAPAIAQDIVKITVGILNQETPVKTNSSFNPIRRRRPNLKNMTLEEKQEIIRQNPDYGIVVCRCEGVSRGEVLDAIRSPLPALSLDAVKRRVRPGMGRCQGGFCSPQILKLIAQEAKTADSAVTKSGGESRILLGETKGDTDERSL